MIDRYGVDFSKTFSGTMLLKVEPKMESTVRNDPHSPKKHAHDKNDVPKWTVHLSVETKSFGDNTKFDNISVTVTASDKPLGDVMRGTPVTVEGLELGIMPKDKGGFSVFYSAEAIRPLQPARMTAPQPLQPTRMASGQ